MIRRGSPFLAAWATALLAVAMLSYASTKALVMQAMDASPLGMSVICSAHMDMTGWSLGDGASGRLAHLPAQPGKGKATVCPYCSAAAHPPVLSSVVPVIHATVVVWLTWPPSIVNGPRGPPAFEARARGPPPFSSAV
ncbi:MAG: DUF2946 family protein [Caulobacteraceae bacterium]|nr:DUF2946 family protein [Caulobacteraceae bacterium]